MSSARISAVLAVAILLVACGDGDVRHRERAAVIETGVLPADHVFAGMFEGRLVVSHVCHTRAPGTTDTTRQLGRRSCLAMDFGIPVKSLPARELVAEMRRRGTRTLDLVGGDVLSDDLIRLLGLSEPEILPMKDVRGPLFRAFAGRRYRLPE